jgi:hypothetical protein
MLEPDVTITDYLLSLASVGFAWWSWRRSGDARCWYVAFFISLALASLLGGTVHGFIPSGILSTWLWGSVLLSLGGTAVTMWGIASALACPPRLRRDVMGAVALLAVVYAVVVLAGWRPFWLAIAAYAPASIAMLLAYLSNLRRPGPWGWGIAGVLLSLVAAGVQVGHVAIHPRYFNHNALYHLVQAIALYGIARVAGAHEQDGHAAGQ